MDKVSTLSVNFDDLMRHYDHHMNYSVDTEFLEFVRSVQEVVRKKWHEAELECTRLQTELVSAHNEMARTETKIQSIRRHLESKIEELGKLDQENEKANLKIYSAKALIQSYIKHIRTGGETNEKMLLNVFNLLEGSMPDDLNTRMGRHARSPNGALDAISEANSTDLSMTQSEDDLDLDVSTRRARNHRQKQGNKRPSLEFKQLNNNSSHYKKHGTKQSVEVSTMDQIVVRTVVSSKNNAGTPLHAFSSVETHPHSKISSETQPSAPPFVSSSDTESEYSAPPPRKTPPSYAVKPSTSYGSPAGYGVRIGNGSQRPHAWCHKTVIKPETCEPCGKRIKFSKLAYKCRDCKATCHPECKDKVPLPCIMTGTPSNKKQMGTVADYAPCVHPMVPALIHHCTSAIEKRGEVILGLYRVPGAEKEVKDLKERFLKGKGVPNLERYDIHAICGCVKDFLKTLQEPLVGRWFWKDFAIAADISDPIKRMIELERIVNELPPANQDTLAFLMLHLQRIAKMKEVSMPVLNLSKVFGPTIVGYSGPDIDGPTMLRETKKQQQVMESFLKADESFWEAILKRPEETGKIYDAHKTSQGRLHSTPTNKGKSPSLLKLRESNKRIYFDDSPKSIPVSEKQRKTYFD